MLYRDALQACSIPVEFGLPKAATAGSALVGAAFVKEL